MKKYFKLAFLLSSIAINVSMASGPARLRLTASIIIDAPADVVWAEIENIEDMYWHPDVVDITLDEESLLSRPRLTLFLRDGSFISEDMRKYDAEKMSISYKIIEMSSVGVTIFAGEDMDIPVLSVSEFTYRLSVKQLELKSIVTWKGYYYPLIWHPQFVEDAEGETVLMYPPSKFFYEGANESVTNFFTTGLVGLARIFDNTANNSDVNIK